MGSNDGIDSMSTSKSGGLSDGSNTTGNGTPLETVGKAPSADVPTPSASGTSPSRASPHSSDRVRLSRPIASRLEGVFTASEPDVSISADPAIQALDSMVVPPLPSSPKSSAAAAVPLAFLGTAAAVPIHLPRASSGLDEASAKSSDVRKPGSASLSPGSTSTKSAGPASGDSSSARSRTNVAVAPNSGPSSRTFVHKEQQSSGDRSSSSTTTRTIHKSESGTPHHRHRHHHHHTETVEETHVVRLHYTCHSGGLLLALLPLLTSLAGWPLFLVLSGWLMGWVVCSCVCALRAYTLVAMHLFSLGSLSCNNVP